MYGNNQVINYFQTNKILALELDKAVLAVRQEVAEKVRTIGAGATRALYYLSCFTEEFNDVCEKQKAEDLRFRDEVYQILMRSDIIVDMLKIYFEGLFKYKTSEQLEYIKKLLMTANIHIATSSLTNAGFTLAVASSVRIGLHVSLEMSALTGTWMTRGVAAAAAYGVVQKAADSAYRLRLQYPSFYSALYIQGLEMLYFLIEPLFLNSGAIEARWATENDIVNIIRKMIR